MLHKSHSTHSPSSPHQDSDIEDTRGSSKPQRSPSTQPSHTRQASVTKHVSVKRSDPPQPSQSSHVKQPAVEEKEMSYSISSKCPSTLLPSQLKQSPEEGSSKNFTPSVNRSRSISQSKSNYLHDCPHKPSTRESNRASQRGHRKRRGNTMTLERNPRKYPRTMDITKNDEWDKQCYCKALYDFGGEMPCNLQFRKSQRIAIVTRTDSQDDWWKEQ